MLVMGVGGGVGSVKDAGLLGYAVPRGDVCRYL